MADYDALARMAGLNERFAKEVDRAIANENERYLAGIQPSFVIRNAAGETCASGSYKTTRQAVRGALLYKIPDGGHVRISDRYGSSIHKTRESIIETYGDPR